MIVAKPLGGKDWAMGVHLRRSYESLFQPTLVCEDQKSHGHRSCPPKPPTPSPPCWVGSPLKRGASQPFLSYILSGRHHGHRNEKVTNTKNVRISHRGNTFAKHSAGGNMGANAVPYLSLHWLTQLHQLKCAGPGHDTKCFQPHEA